MKDAPESAGPGRVGRRRFLGLALVSSAVPAAIARQLETPEYRRAVPGYTYQFPRDHGAHPDYRIEWWYYTGHLDGAGGERYGYELTFFRVGVDRIAANPSAWNVRDLHLAHFAVSDLGSGQFRYFERVNRQGPGIAVTETGTLRVRNESWSAMLNAETTTLRAFAGGILMELDLVSIKPPVIHGIDGVSQKADGAGQASHYYSLTRLSTSGLLSFDGAPVLVQGESWMDHEFGTSQLASDQVGWDWFSLQLNNGEELMLYQLRRIDGSIDPNSSGTLVDRSGQGSHLAGSTFSVRSMREWGSPESGAIYPLDWDITVGPIAAALRVRVLMDDQELVTTRSTGIAYWEGAVEVEGTWRGQSVLGRGYVELTGYREDFRPDV
jgi:predicted secreted hydrolase